MHYHPARCVIFHEMHFFNFFFLSKYWKFHSTSSLSWCMASQSIPYGGEEFKEPTNPGHEVKHDLAYSVDSSWYGFVYRHSNGNSLLKLSGL